MTDLHRAIVEAMARALFVSAWADSEEERGRSFPPGANLTELAPETSADARAAAHNLAGRFEELNRMSLEALIAAAAVSDRKAVDPSEFGSDLALQALGHGVSWFDDHAAFDLEFPYHFEFSLDEEDEPVAS